MKSIILALSVALWGCSTPAIVREPVEVMVPIPIPCVDSNQIPPMIALETETVQRNDILGDKVVALVDDFKRLKESNRVLRELLQGCL